MGAVHIENGRYVNAAEAAKRLGIAPSRMNVFLRDSRVKGAIKLGKIWIVPLPIQVVEHENPSHRPPKIKMQPAS
jgi:hypothetical protein